MTDHFGSELLRCDTKCRGMPEEKEVRGAGGREYLCCSAGRKALRSVGDLCNFREKGELEGIFQGGVVGRGGTSIGHTAVYNGRITGDRLGGGGEEWTEAR